MLIMWIVALKWSDLASYFYSHEVDDVVAIDVCKSMIVVFGLWHKHHIVDNVYQLMKPNSWLSYCQGDQYNHAMPFVDIDLCLEPTSACDNVLVFQSM